mmetsp:Transcript_11459/g.21002  ORF Transcript_11459/g.21002 Transcript_11459/m.21002 type:complete len:119 (-) Transcript_11459:203-559(-)
MLATSVHAQVGRLVMSVGGLFAFLGFSIFDNGLLALGNIFLVTGCFIWLGFDKSRSMLFQRDNLKFTVFLAIGFVVVLSGRPRVGILFEVFALYNLMKSYIHRAFKFAKGMLSYVGLG